VAGPFSSHHEGYHRPYLLAVDDEQNGGRRYPVDGSGLPLGRGSGAAGIVILISKLLDEQATAKGILSPGTLEMRSGCSGLASCAAQR
jgi:hypothetical protein